MGTDAAEKIERLDVDWAMLKHLKAVHAKKGLHLATSSGLSGTIDIEGDRELPVTMLIQGCARALELENAVPTPDAYAAACKALAHWRREAKRLGKLVGEKPREMKR